MAREKLNLRRSELAEDQPLKINVSGKDIVLILRGGKIFAMDGICTHEKGHLDEGYVENGELICPLHAGAFAIETGRANENTPWVTDLGFYRIEEDPSGLISVYL